MNISQLIKPRVLRGFFLTFSVLLCCNSISAQHLPFQDSTLAPEERAKDLISRLTLEEKIGFLEHQNPGVERLGIKPYSWWNEALHGIARNGIATVYPMPIALAATFDPQLIQKVYSDIALEGVRKHRESQAAGEYGDNTGLTFFTPNINIFRDPRWGRGMETFGEDPYLTAQMGLAAVNGLQGKNSKFKIQNSKLLSAACLKHLAVHSGPEGLRHQFDARISNRDLWNTYLPAFEYIIKHGDVQQVMCAYNRLNGEPCCTNQHLLVDILRNRWQYDGILVTDCWALNDCWEPDTVIPRHRTHPSAEATAAAAFGSEVDLECGSGLNALKTAVDSGYISEDIIDKHLKRVLTTRFSLAGSAENAEKRKTETTLMDATSSSIVMLKNNGILPLKEASDYRQIAVIGPNAADSAMALGNYNGTPPYTTTILDAFNSQLSIDNSKFIIQNSKFRIFFDTACHLADNDYKLSRKFWKQIEKSDVVVFCGGLSPALEGEELQVNMPGFHKGDRTTIELPAPQRNMIKEIKRRTGKPIVLVLCTGSAIALEEIVDDVDAIIVAWYGGQEMGTAVCNALSGYSNDFGRLPVTFYKSTSQLPPFEDYDMQGRTYRYMTEEPLFPFGYGLSYSKTHYENVTFDRNTMTVSGSIVLDSNYAKTTNGKEIVQVYLEDPTCAECPKRRMVACQSVKFQDSSSNSQFSILIFQLKIDSFWLRRYNAETDSMELPPAGTPMRLCILGGPTMEFTW